MFVGWNQIFKFKFQRTTILPIFCSLSSIKIVLVSLCWQVASASLYFNRRSRFSVEEGVFVKKGHTDERLVHFNSVWTPDGKKVIRHCCPLLLTSEVLSSLFFSGSTDHYWPSHGHHLTILCVYDSAWDSRYFCVVFPKNWLLISLCFQVFRMFRSRMSFADFRDAGSVVDRPRKPFNKVSCFKFFC